MSLPIHAGLLPPLLDFLLRGMHWSWAWRKWCLNSNQLSWTPLLSRALTRGIPPSRSLKRPKLTLLKSKIMILLTALLLLCRILNSTISWSLQPRLPLTFTSSTSPSLFISTRSSITSLLVGSSTTCVKKLSSMLCRNLLDCVCLAVWSFQQISGWLKSPYENQGLWLWGYFHLPVEGLIDFFFLVRWPVVNMHNKVSHMSLCLDSYP